MPYSQEIQDLILETAFDGPAAGALTQNLRARGYTMAQISQMISAVASTSALTPQMIAWMQQENGFVADRIAANYRMWMLIFAGGFALYLYGGRRR